jgi:hypothetical protein
MTTKINKNHNIAGGLDLNAPLATRGRGLGGDKQYLSIWAVLAYVRLDELIKLRTFTMLLDISEHMELV